MSFRLSTKEIVGVAIGAALFGVLMVYGGITIFTNTKLSSAYVIPVIIGALFGPIPAGFSRINWQLFCRFFRWMGLLDRLVSGQLFCVFLYRILTIVRCEH